MRDDLDAEQISQAPPLRCRRCGDFVYLEVLKDGRKRYVEADTLEPHTWRCARVPTQEPAKGSRHR